MWSPKNREFREILPFSQTCIFLKIRNFEKNRRFLKHAISSKSGISRISFSLKIFLLNKYFNSCCTVVGRLTKKVCGHPRLLVCIQDVVWKMTTFQSVQNSIVYTFDILTWPGRISSNATSSLHYKLLYWQLIEQHDVSPLHSNVCVFLFWFIHFQILGKCQRKRGSNKRV